MERKSASVVDNGGLNAAFMHESQNLRAFLTMPMLLILTAMFFFLNLEFNHVGIWGHRLGMQN